MSRLVVVIWSSLALTACGGDAKPTAETDSGAMPDAGVDANSIDANSTTDGGMTDANSALDGSGENDSGDELPDGAVASDSGDLPDAGSALDPALQAWLLDGPATPLDLIIQVDTARGIDAVVGVEGGSFSVTAADGTLFELTIPPNAVFNDTPIQMAPITTIDGLPSELSAAHAVQLEPEGLTFFGLLSLRIVTTAPTPISEAVPFGFHADGAEMFLTHRGVSSDHPIVLLDHFSGYGVARGSILDSPGFVERMGWRVEDRFRSRMAWEEMRARRHLPADPTIFPMPSDISPFYEFYRERVIEGRFAMGVTQCDAGLSALAMMTGFVHDRYLAGVPEWPDGPSADLMPLIPYVVDVSRRCLMEEYELCVRSNDRVFHRLLPFWRGLRHQAVQYGLGLGDGAALDQLDMYAEGLADMCLQFDLNFVSTVDFDPDGGGYHVAVRSQVMLRLRPENIVSGQGMLQGVGDMETTAFTFRTEGCGVTSDPGPDVPFTVEDLIFHTAPYVLWRERGQLESITLRYFPGVTAQQYTVTCDMAVFVSPPEPLWTAAYVDTHPAEITEDDSFEAIDWTLSSLNPVAEKSWMTTGSDADLTEVGSFELVHQPGG